MMKIQFLNGGLANQTFQYIFSRYYELTYPGEIMYLDDSYFALNTVHNGYELEKVFGVHPHMLSECFSDDVWEYILEQRKLGKSIPEILNENGENFIMIAEASNYKEFNPFTGKIGFVNCNQYHPEILSIDNDSYYHGYWLHRSWFEQYKEALQGELVIQEPEDYYNKMMIEKMREGKSLAIHVRRGDFVKLGVAVDEEIYREFIEYYLEKYNEKWTGYVFSDDIPWCKEHVEELGLSKLPELEFVEGNINGNNYRDLQLMSQCRGMIVPNSSFSYLASLLNQNSDRILYMDERMCK